MNTDSTFVEDVNKAFVLINQRKQIFLSDKSPYAKLIALAIAEHMSCENLNAFPAKNRLMKLCSIKEATFDRHWKEAQSFFHANPRPGKSTIFSPNIVRTAAEILVLWDSEEPCKPRLKLVCNQDTPPRNMQGGKNANPPANSTPLQYDPPSKTGQTPPQYDPPNRIEYIERENTRVKKVASFGVATTTAAMIGASAAAAHEPPTPPHFEPQVQQQVQQDGVTVCDDAITCTLKGRVIRVDYGSIDQWATLEVVSIEKARGIVEAEMKGWIINGKIPDYPSNWLRNQLKHSKTKDQISAIRIENEKKRGQNMGYNKRPSSDKDNYDWALREADKAMNSELPRPREES
jgi:hypothetical protein